MPSARIVGHRRPKGPGLRWPGAAEEAFLDRPFRKVLLRKPCGVRRYRSHEEAQEDMQRLLDEEAARTPLITVVADERHVWMSDEAPLPEPGGPCAPATWEHLKIVLALFEKYEVEYALIGGFAMNLLGLSRHTGDIDILVGVSPENNTQWIRAISDLPDGVAATLAELDNQFSPDFETHSDGEEDGVIRVFDAFVVDIMPKACGLSYDELAPFLVRAEHDGIAFQMLGPDGMLLSKKGSRPNDQSDALWLRSNLERLRESCRPPQGRSPKP